MSSLVDLQVQLEEKEERVVEMAEKTEEKNKQGISDGRGS